MSVFEVSFTCVICERAVSNQWVNPRDRRRLMPPICRPCEEHYGEREPASGTFMDRRMATRIAVLANALRSAAAQIEWRGKYGRA